MFKDSGKILYFTAAPSDLVLLSEVKTSSAYLECRTPSWFTKIHNLEGRLICVDKILEIMTQVALEKVGC